MEPAMQEILRRMRVEIVDQLAENAIVVALVDALVAEKALTRIERSDICCRQMPEDKVRTMLDHLERKPGVFMILIRSLDSERIARGDLAKKLWPGHKPTHVPATNTEKPESGIKIEKTEIPIATVQLSNGKDNSSDLVTDATPDLGSYEMTKSKLGHCLIINNHRFKNAKLNRKGSEDDVNAMQKLFEELKFKVTIEPNLDAAQIKQVINEFSFPERHRAVGCFVCVVMSHGKEGVIHGVDEEPVNIDDDIIAKFQACESLMKKPKIFIFQACRGDMLALKADGGAIQEKTSHDAEAPVKQKFVSTTADVLIAYPTALGFVAFRRESSLHDKGGSWFIQSLVDVIRRFYKRHHLADMLTEVNRIVTEEVTFVEGQKVCAISNHTTTLTKRLYFK